MSFNFAAAIRLKNPVVMSNRELAAWAQVGKNSIPLLVARFDLHELSGTKNHRYPVHDVFRKILGVNPQTAEDFERLLIPLQKVSWVSRITGMSVSAISASVGEKRSPLPSPVQLTVTGPGQAPPRSRRWIPAQIEAHLRGDPIPFLAPQTTDRKAPSKLIQAPARNVFAAICSGNSKESR